MRNVRMSMLGMSAAIAGAASGQIDLGIAADDVWAYISAQNPSQNVVLSVWGLQPNDLNPLGFPGPSPSRNFYSHAFLGWDLPAPPAGYRWGGARITLTLASDTYIPENGEVYARFLNRGFDETTWNILTNTPVPVPALGRLVGNDTGATNTGDTVTIDLPASLDPQAWRPWLTAGQVYLAITSDSTPPPPTQPGQPPDLTGVLQIFSGEDAFGDGPTIVLFPGRLGDTNGDGAVNFLDLNDVLAFFGQTGPALRADLNRDNEVNFTDLNEVLANFDAR